MFPIFAGNSASTGYNLTRSLRFRASASAYLNRTQSAGNQTTWTFSAWIKLGLTGGSYIFHAGSSSGSGVYYDATAEELQVEIGNGTTQYYARTSASFRDFSAWYHLVCVADTSNATSTNRLKIYVNGVLQTIGVSSYPTSSFSGTMCQSGVASNIGRFGGGSLYFDGYLTEVNFIDGQALTPASFGSTNVITGVWQPARYTGTYGTNGFYLPFTDNSALTTSSNVGLGRDYSGNGNYWVTNNISITAGVTYDSMTDVPTLTSATAANFAVLNPLTTTAGTYSNANLQYYGASAWRRTNGTIAVNSGKFYWEVTISNAPFTPRASNSPYNSFGFGLSTVFNSTSSASTVTDAIILGDNAYYKNFSGAWTDSGLTFVSGDVLSVAVDLTANTFTFYRNNSSVVTGTIGVTAGTELTPIILSYDNSYGLMNANFGQRPFTYTPPTGFVALNTFNLPDSTIKKGNSVMDATLYTGTGASLSVTNAASFKPDLVWVKSRSAATDHAWYDSVRGTTKQLESNTTTAETTEATGLTAFGSAGFTVGALAQMNTSAATYVGWQWQAGQGSTSSNTNGSITSTVSVNASAGFSVVTYTGTGVAATVGHGLGVAPSWIVVKGRTNVSDWRVYHSSVALPNVLNLNSTAAAASDAGAFGSTAPTSSVFTLGTGAGTNGSANTYVAYCWTPIAGYSAFGSYTGNGSTDGPFVYTGFRPKFFMIKCTQTADYGHWSIRDSSRSPSNIASQQLYANFAFSEDNEVTEYIDLLSNGVKLRGNLNGINGSGLNYIYMAFAENPLKYSLAR